jgi:HprK-related kinase B
MNPRHGSAAWISLRLRVRDFRLLFETDSTALASRVSSYFEAYLDPTPDPAHERLVALETEAEFDAHQMRPWRAKPGRVPKESFYDRDGHRYILKNRTGLLIVRGAGTTVASGPVTRNAHQIINLVGTMFGISLLRQGFLMVHASGVVERSSGRARVFLGNSGSGKSSVALQLLERGGYDYLSNDRILLRTAPGGVAVAGLPKQPRVNPGTLLASPRLIRLLPRPRRRLYAELRPSELWSFEEKTDVDVTRDLGATTRLSAPLGEMYTLDWRPDGSGLDIDACDAANTFRALQLTSKDFGPYDLHAQPTAADDLSAIARRARCLRVTGRADPALLAARIASTPRRLDNAQSG